MTKTVELVIATHNLGKMREFRQMLKGIQDFSDFFNISLLSLINFPDFVPDPETEDSFKGNAIQKAMKAAQELNKLVLADDSGLVVPSLGGSPGVISKRYAGEEATDRENRKKLLLEMKGKTGLERAAYFECWLAMSSPQGLLKCVMGRCEGEITLEERGSHGFGYDPIFIKHGYNKTFGELDDFIKNRLSHRWKAVEALIPFLQSYLPTVENM